MNIFLSKRICGRRKVDPWLEALFTWVSNEQTQAQPEGQAKEGKPQFIARPRSWPPLEKTNAMFLSHYVASLSRHH